MNIGMNSAIAIIALLSVTTALNSSHFKHFLHLYMSSAGIHVKHKHNKNNKSKESNNNYAKSNNVGTLNKKNNNIRKNTVNSNSDTINSIPYKILMNRQLTPTSQTLNVTDLDKSINHIINPLKKQYNYKIDKIIKELEIENNQLQDIIHQISYNKLEI